MATEKLSEQEIQLRKRARRRLVGAIALVLLMVTILPMVLDDREAQSPQSEIAVNIPSQDGGDFASKIVPVAPGTEGVPQAGEPPAAQSPVQPEPAPEKAPEPQAEPAQPVPPEPAKTEAPAPSELAATERPAAGEDTFMVQIGVFSDAANVKQLQSKLAADGFKSFTEKLSTPNGSKTRLRVGPYATRADAEKARDKLKAAGTAGIVVTK